MTLCKQTPLSPQNNPEEMLQSHPKDSISAFLGKIFHNCTLKASVAGRFRSFISSGTPLVLPQRQNTQSRRKLCPALEQHSSAQEWDNCWLFFIRTVGVFFISCWVSPRNLPGKKQLCCSQFLLKFRHLQPLWGLSKENRAFPLSFL